MRTRVLDHQALLSGESRFGGRPAHRGGHEGSRRGCCGGLAQSLVLREVPTELASIESPDQLDPAPSDLDSHAVAPDADSIAVIVPSRLYDAGDLHEVSGGREGLERQREERVVDGILPELLQIAKEGLAAADLQLVNPRGTFGPPRESTKTCDDRCPSPY